MSLLTKFKIFLKPCIESVDSNFEGFHRHHLDSNLEGFHRHQNRKPCVINFKDWLTYAKLH